MNQQQELGAVARAIIDSNVPVTVPVTVEERTRA
jgi:hypothetical protein